MLYMVLVVEAHHPSIIYIDCITFLILYSEYKAQMWREREREKKPPWKQKKPPLIGNTEKRNRFRNLIKIDVHHSILFVCASLSLFFVCVPQKHFVRWKKYFINSIDTFLMVSFTVYSFRGFFWIISCSLRFRIGMITLFSILTFFDPSNKKNHFHHEIHNFFSFSPFITLSKLL